MGLDSDRSGSASASGSASGYRYAIRVEGLLHDHWSQWLEGMAITQEGDGICCLEGHIIDQDVLHGLFQKLKELRLPIVAVQRLDAVGSDAPCLEEWPENTGLTTDQDLDEGPVLRRDDHAAFGTRRRAVGS